MKPHRQIGIGLLIFSYFSHNWFLSHFGSNHWLASGWLLIDNLICVVGWMLVLGTYRTRTEE